MFVCLLLLVGAVAHDELCVEFLLDFSRTDNDKQLRLKARFELKTSVYCQYGKDTNTRSLFVSLVSIRNEMTILEGMHLLRSFIFFALALSQSCV